MQFKSIEIIIYWKYYKCLIKYIDIVSEEVKIKYNLGPQTRSKEII